MQAMTGFFSAMLGIVADFLASEPIIYLFGCILLLFVVKAIMMIINYKKG